VWYHIEYEKLDKLDDNLGRFHAQWRRENLTEAIGEHLNQTIHPAVNPDGKENYVILEAEGQGNFVGYFLNVDNVQGGWYGEGDDMIFIDGEEWPPSFHGTGSEEIFGGGACPNVPYTGPYTGFHLVGNPGFQGKQSMYRFFVNDPVRFTKSIEVSIEHGTGNNLANDYSSTAFWYQTEPHAPFPELPPAAERRPHVGTDPHDVAYREVQRLQNAALASLGALNVRQIQQVVSTELTRALDDHDYETAIEECKKGMALLDTLLKQHEAQQGE